MFSACATPHIQNNNNILKITMKDKSIVKGTGELIYENRVNLVNIDIEQKVYIMDDGSVLTYEDAPVSTGYVYSYGMKRIVGIIFPQYNYDLIDTKGNIFFFKLYSKTDIQYMILENMNKKRIKFVYGISQNVFQSIFNSLINEQKMPKNTQIINRTIKDDKTLYIKSKWSSKNIIVDTIITRTGSMSNLRM